MTDGTASKLPIRLKEARLQRGKTLEAVAEAIDSSLTTIWRYEAGQRRPSGPTLYALATLYNKPVEWFFGEETEHPDADVPKSENIELRMGIAERLRTAREELGWTRREVGERAGVDLNMIYEYESGRRNPSTLALRGLASLYGRSVEWFFGEEEESQASTEHPDADAPKSENIDLTDSDIARLVQLYRRMSPHARTAWLDVGEALLGPGHS